MDQETFQKELTAIGGLNLYGEPNLRVVRGDQEMKFACERMIPKYFVPGGAVKTVEKKFRKRNMFSNQVFDCTFDEAKEIWERSMQHDLSNIYIAETCRIITITPTAQEGYFVEQYYPPEMIKDTPETWEASRRRMWFDEEKGREVLTDIIGEFPHRGRYELFAQSEELDSKLLKSVRRAWSRRDQWKQVKSAELMVKDIYDAHAERDAKNEATVKEMLDSAIVPHSFQGVYLNKPSKFIHDGEAKTI